MNKTEYEKNPHAYWGAPQPGRGSNKVISKLPDISKNPIWAKNIFPEIKLNINHELCLDLGCGGGRYIGHTSEYFKKVIGIDFSRYNIERATKDYRNFDNIEFILANLTDISMIKNNSVDFAYSAAVFLHMPNSVKQVALKELARVLKPEGHAVLVEIVPIENGAFDCPDIKDFEWKDIVNIAGLRIEINEDADPFRKYKLCKVES